MLIYDAKVNHLTNPLGYRMERTVFSWKVKEAAGKHQEAARIVVAADEEMRQILLDTGFDMKADSLGWELPVKLAPRTRYYWTVTVKSDAQETAESGVQWFETGKRDEKWEGCWISCDSVNPRHPYLEKRIEPKKEVASARLYICGLGLYEAYYTADEDEQQGAGNRSGEGPACAEAKFGENSKTCAQVKSFEGAQSCAGVKAGESAQPYAGGAMERISDEYFTPYSNNYNRWLQYQTYDVTQQLQRAGVLSVLLGNGWYKGRFGFDVFEEKGCYGDEWRLIAELRLQYTDGTEEVIGTDESWTVRRSRITFSSLYDGEHRDDTLAEPGNSEHTPEASCETGISGASEQAMSGETGMSGASEQAMSGEAGMSGAGMRSMSGDADMRGADASDTVYLCDAPSGVLTERMSTPVTVHETFAPVELLHTPAGELVLDMGQEFAGIFRLRIHDVPAGATVRVQTGEVLQGGNFYNDNLRSAKSEYIYVSDGTETEIVPHFTWYGYRYVKIEGMPKLAKEDFTGLALYSEIPETGTLQTGHALVNQLLSNVRWGLKSNFLDVPTDCPQRDERMGWTGDAQVFTPTALYLQDAYAFYAKYLYDMYQEQLGADGMVPIVVPAAGKNTSACVWGDAACIMPWAMYNFYGDKSILKDQYASMKAWVDYVKRVDGDNHGWRYIFHFGDWLALDNPSGKIDEVLGGTDEEFIANVYYAASAELVSKAATVLGYEEDAAEYARLAAEQFAEVKREYYSVTGRCCIKTQTALILTLKYHLSENVELTRQMLRALFEKCGNKLKTGFVGTPLLGNVLTENGMSDLAYHLLLNEEFPGWLHEVLLGATTVWERWNSVLDDGSISSTGMNSLNHYSYGSIVEWMYRHVAGISGEETAPGFREVRLAPIPNRELGSAAAQYDSATGVYRSAWELSGDEKNHIALDFSVPFGGRAKVVLPGASEEIFQDKANPLFAHVENGICVAEAGDYHVEYELACK